jgi:hypothetical protein
VDKLIEVHRRNIDALGRSAQVATEGAKSLADKQREIIETAFRETSAMVAHGTGQTFYVRGSVRAKLDTSISNSLTLLATSWSIASRRSATRY